jgi:hypothetical protein
MPRLALLAVRLRDASLFRVASASGAMITELVPLVVRRVDDSLVAQCACCEHFINFRGKRT